MRTELAADLQLVIGQPFRENPRTKAVEDHQLEMTAPRRREIRGPCVCHRFDFEFIRMARDLLQVWRFTQLFDV
jgi:hypothetical protein